MDFLTETERITLKHVLGLSEDKINQFENLNFDWELRRFLIFDMMMKS